MIKEYKLSIKNDKFKYDVKASSDGVHYKKNGVYRYKFVCIIKCYDKHEVYWTKPYNVYTSVYNRFIRDDLLVRVSKLIAMQSKLYHAEIMSKLTIGKIAKEKTNV